MKRAFGELELAILYILEAGPRKTVKDVHQELGGKDKYTTVMTVMNRLVEKNKLGRERHGLQYEYWIISSESQMPSLIQQLKDKIFGVKTAKLVSHLIDTSTDMTEEEFAEIEMMVKAAKQRRQTESKK